MTSIFSKLNLKDQKEILVVNAPSSFEVELAGLTGVKVARGPQEISDIYFALVFATRLGEINSIAPLLAEKARGDAVIWFAYPKGSSKKYKCEFNRDTGWDAMRAAGFERVRMVAIDEDWSALRFRRLEYRKT